MITVRIWFLLVVMATGAEASTLLRDLHYTVSRERTRLALEASGPVRYAAREEDGRLVLRCAGLRLAPGVFAGRRYREGLIERIEFERPAPDTVAIRLAFRAGATYRLVRAANGALEIQAEGPYYAPPPKPRPRPAKKEEEEAVATPMKPLIDIGALAMEQAKEGMSAPKPPAGGPTPVTTPVRPAEAGAAALGWVLAVMISIATTAATLIVLARRKPVRPTAPKVAGETSAADTLFPKHLLEALASGTETGEEEGEEEPEASAWLAERFQRGADEVDLAFKLRGAGAAEAKARIARELSGRAIPASRLAQSARRTGVGLGEMELARNLRKLATAQQRKEKTP